MDQGLLLQVGSKSGLRIRADWFGSVKSRCVWSGGVPGTEKPDAVAATTCRALRALIPANCVPIARSGRNGWSRRGE